ncbi:STAS domain-containing protein [Streptomyces sp. NPDC051909]|uniref:STAS domain-containing protein n=1 Tax=Streptomyces sp. NPDC051909 TaxID=3154944 RepID=UPI00342BB3C9
MRAEELLRTHTLWCGDVVLLRVQGELDLATAPLLNQAVTALLAGRPRTLCLDLADLVFCDRTGLLALSRLSARAHAARATVRLTGLHPHLHRTLTRYPHASPWDPDHTDTTRYRAAAHPRRSAIFHM